MSFISSVKEELLQPIKSENNANAFLSGLIKSAGIFTLKDKKLHLEIKTEIKPLCDFVNIILKKQFGKTFSIRADDSKLISRPRFIISADEILTEKVIKLVNLNGETKNISDEILSNEDLTLNFIKGVFVGSATSNIVLKSLNPNVSHSGGYHLEFVLSNEIFAKEFAEVLLNKQIKTKTTMRRDNFLVYIKESETISDLFAYLGASESMLLLQNEIAVRQVRNSVNRQNNCLSGNITKTIDASMRQIEAIEMIQKKVGLEVLDEDLQELCLLRLSNPEEPLVNLIKLYSKPISKSGMNHRFSKIEKFALSLIDL